MLHVNQPLISTEEISYRKYIPVLDTTMAYVDVGAGGSQLTWQISSGLGYQFNKWGAVSLTYRYLSFHHGSATVDTVSMKGPVLTANISF